MALRDPATQRGEPSLVEMLSPRLRLDEQPEQPEQPEPEQPEQPEQAEQGDSAPAPPAPGTCEIRWSPRWPGSRFYVEAEPSLSEPIESLAFLARGRTAPARNIAAVAAHEVVLQGLAAAGWKPDGHGTLWFSDRFKRVQVDAGAEAAEPAEAPAVAVTPMPAAVPNPAEPDREKPNGRNSSFVW